jgi:hypothetical protein
MQPTELPENVFIYEDWKPSKEDSDDVGNVLWYKPGFGWYQGWYNSPAMDGTTHWTHVPPKPPALVDPKVARNDAFDRWLRTFPSDAKLDDVVVALLRLGWNAGWVRGR